MTPEQAAALRVGDIVEFSNDCCYWLAKLVKLEKKKGDAHGIWKVVNHAKSGAGGASGTVIMQYPENVTLVGHSDSLAPFENEK